jgi:hypothetical protein
MALHEDIEASAWFVSDSSEFMAATPDGDPSPSGVWLQAQSRSSLGHDRGKGVFVMHGKIG